MSQVKNALKAALKKVGFRLTRSGYSNRFQGMEEALSCLARTGYIPSAIIDGGANRGDWAREARSVFPAVHIHLIEPLPKCVALLRDLAAQDGRMTVHPFAATLPGPTELKFNLAGEDGMATSAQVALPGENLQHEIVLSACTMDALLERTIYAGALLKLDLQGHEIEALKGATTLMKNIEVIICEVSFYHVNNSGRAIFPDVMTFIFDLGYELYDIASLAGRYNDNRLQWGDIVFVKRGSRLLANNAWQVS